MALSLYLHINNNLKKDHKLPFNGGPATRNSRKVILDSLTKALKQVGIKVDSIELHQNSDFLIVTSDHNAGVLLLNIHQKLPILELLYNYLQTSKKNFCYELIRTSQSSQKHAKNLIDQVLATPNSSPRLYLILDQIQNTLSQ